MTTADSWEKLDPRTVVLVGARDFGRCPLGARLPAALWPLADKPVLQRLLDHLAAEGLPNAVVCCGCDVAASVEAVCADSRLTVTLEVEDLACGTAGCLRNAVASDSGGLLVVLSGSLVAPPPLRELVEGHLAGGAELTMAFNPGRDPGSRYGSPAEIYLCRPQVLSHIPACGYSDIKEGLIPSLLRAGGRVCPVALDSEVGGFHDRRGYLDAIGVFFRHHRLDDDSCRANGGAAETLVLQGAEVFVHPGARICGPVAIGAEARILEGAVVIGPATIGRQAVLGENSVIVRTALWAGAKVGARCEIRESVVDQEAAVPEGLQIMGEVLSADVRKHHLGVAIKQRVGHAVDQARDRLSLPLERLAERLPAWAPRSPRQLAYALGGVVLTLAFLGSYWPTFVDLLKVWRRSDEYSAGLLVPFLAAYIIWSRRNELASVAPRPAVLWGIGAFLFAQTIRAAGLYLMFRSAERLSLLLSIVALVLLVLGWTHLKKLTPILVFLCLMLPWPNRVQAALALPLQRWATSSAVFCLELVGYEVVQDGNVIHLGTASVAVAEACNGLRMITAFFVITGLVVLLVKRAWWEKLAILASSLPIALLCNTLRLAVTAVFFTWLEGEAWEQRFHDWGGYAMMPLALALVVAELWLLARLTTPPTETKPVIISRQQA